jgi:hypothetical protein
LAGVDGLMLELVQGHMRSLLELTRVKLKFQTRSTRHDHVL